MLRLASLANKTESISLLRQCIMLWIFPHSTMEERSSVMEYMRWMREQREPLTITCAFKALADGRRGMRLTIEATFDPLPEATR